MKKAILIILTVIVLASCSSDDTVNYRFKFLPITEAMTPDSFTFNSIDTIRVKYNLPDNCHSFRGVHYQYRDTTRIVAINAIEFTDRNCDQVITEKELKIPVHVRQEEDYVFKFWKGKDTEGNNIFEEIVVPVN